MRLDNLSRAIFNKKRMRRAFMSFCTNEVSSASTIPFCFTFWLRQIVHVLSCLTSTVCQSGWVKCIPKTVNVLFHLFRGENKLQFLTYLILALDSIKSPIYAKHKHSKQLFIYLLIVFKDEWAPHLKLGRLSLKLGRRRIHSSQDSFHPLEM